MATATQIADAIAGRFGPVVPTWRLHNVTRKGNFLADLTPALVLDAGGGVEGGSLSCDNGRESIMQMRCSLLVNRIPGGISSLDHLALFEDRVVRVPTLRRVVYDGETRGYSDPPEPETVSFPLGVYFPAFGDTRYDSYGQPIIEVEGTDLTAHLLREQTDDAYSIASSTGYGTALETVLDLVEVRHAIPSTGFSLPVAYNRPIATPLHTIGRDLMDGINYYPPFFSLVGIATTRPRVDPAAVDADAHYSDDDQPRMLIDLVQHADEATGTNRCVVVADDPRRTDLDPRYVRYQNADPTSPISTDTGDYSQPRVLNIDARPSTLALHDMEVAADVARYELREAAGDARRVTITTLPDPRRGPRETYLVTQADSVTAQKYRVLSWRRDLRIGGLMTHELALADEVAISPWAEAA